MTKKAALSLVKTAIQKTINQKVDNFDVILSREKKTVDFRLYDYTDKKGKFHKRKIVDYDEGPKLYKIFENFVREYVKNGDVIEMVVVSYKFMTVEMLITRDGEKLNIDAKI